MSEPFFSFVVPVYRVREEYLKECLDSLRSQTFPEWEAVLVDDGSPDDSGAICDAYAARDGRFHVLHQENRGVSAARNAGIAAACGRWIWPVDADDRIEANALSEIFARLETDEETDIFRLLMLRDYPDGSVAPSPVHFSESERCVRPDASNRPALLNAVLEPPGFSKASTVREHCFFLCDKLFRRSFLREHQLYLPENIRVSEDRHMVFRCLLVCRTLRRENLSFYHYRRHGENTTVSYLPWMAEDRIRLFEEMESLSVQAEEMLGVPGAMRKSMNDFVLMGASEVLFQDFYHPSHPKGAERRREARSFMRHPLVLRALRETKLSELHRANAFRVLMMRLGMYGPLTAMIRASHARRGPA